MNTIVKILAFTVVMEACYSSFDMENIQFMKGGRDAKILFIGGYMRTNKSTGNFLEMSTGYAVDS